MREQKNQTAPVVDLKTLDTITQLESKGSQQDTIEGSLEVEMEYHQKIFEDQNEYKLQLLQSIQEQKQEMGDLQH